MIYRFGGMAPGNPVVAAALDLTGGVQDGHGGLLLRLQLEASESRHMLRDPMTGAVTRFRKVLAKPLMMELRLDTSGLLALAAKAVRSKSGKSKKGPVTVRGGGRAEWTRRDEDIPE